MNNDERLNRAEAALDVVMDATGDEDVEAAVTDLLTDLQHFCKEHKLDFARRYAMAQMHFEAETDG